MELYILVLLFMTGLVCSEEVYRIPLMYKGYKVYEDIVLDREKNTMLVATGNLDHIPGKSTINLHEFNKHVVAIKNVNSGRCTVVQTQENMAFADSVIYNITKLNMTYPPNIMHLLRSRTKLSHDEVTSLGGQLVANFCKGYDSYFARRLQSGAQIRQRFLVESGPQVDDQEKAQDPEVAICFIDTSMNNGPVYAAG